MIPQKDAQGAVRRLRDLLRLEVANSPGHEVPDEQAIVSAFGVSRGTARRALELLGQGGLIVRRRGVGTSALEQSWEPSTRILHGRDDDEEVVDELRGQSVGLLSWQTVPSSRAVATLLGRAADECLVVEYVVWRAGVPVCTVAHWVRLPDGAALNPAGLTPAWFSFVARAGLDIAETDWVNRAAAADELDSGQLQVPVGSPLFTGDGLIYDSTGEVLGIIHTRARPEVGAIHTRSRWPSGT